MAREREQARRDPPVVPPTIPLAPRRVKGKRREEGQPAHEEQATTPVRSSYPMVNVEDVGMVPASSQRRSKPLTRSGG